MSWLFSRALVVECLGASFSGGAPSALWSQTLTLQACWLPDKTTARSPRFPSGMTCGRLTGKHGRDAVTWCLGAFRARTFHLQTDAPPGFRASGQGSGAQWRASFAKWDRVTCSWKTPQLSLLGGSESSSVTWPRWGLMQRGACWERITPGHLTSGTGFGSSEKRWPTPTAHNAKEAAHPSEYKRNQPTLAAQAGGKLNPTWVEWLMGWPLGWTDLGVLATGKSRQWQRLHGALWWAV